MGSLARVAIALAACRGDTRKAERWAEERYGRLGPEQRALMISEEDAGGALVGPEMDAQFASALRSTAVVRRLGARTQPLQGGRKTAKVLSGAELFYIGDGDAIPVTQQKLGALHLENRKLAAMVPIKKSLLRASPDLAEPLVERDLVEGVASVEDGQFIAGEGTEHTPKGLRYWAHDDNVLAASGASDFDTVVAELNNLMAALEDEDVAMRQPGWIMAPRTRRFLATLQDNAGSLAFKDELANGQLFGHPVGATTGVPTDLGDGGDESFILFCDFSEATIGEAPLRLDVSDQAAFIQDEELRAAFSGDVRLVRVIVEHDLSVRHREAVAVLTGVTWGS